LGSDLWHKHAPGGEWTIPSLGEIPGGNVPVTFLTDSSGNRIWGMPHTQTIHSSVSGKYYLPLYFMAWPIVEGGPNGIDTSVKLYESTDGVTWNLAITLADEPPNSQGKYGGYEYCSLTDPSGTANHEAGQKFDVYCYKITDSTVFGPNTAQYRWTVNLGTVTDFSRQSVDFSST